MSPRLISAIAALPISFLFIPYAFWRSQDEPWYSVFIRPLALILIAWLVMLVVPIPILWLPGIVVIIWQSAALRSAVEKQRPRKLPESESWRR